MRVLFILILTVVSLTAKGQSFYHKKMKKVRNPEISNCQAMKPDKTHQHRKSQAILYRKKRKQ